MLKMKKIALGTVLLSGLVLTACTDDTVASSTAGRISETDLYNEMKQTVGPVFLEQLMITDILEDRYGEEVTQEDVDAVYNEEQERLGGEDSMEYALMTQNLTPEMYRDNIHLNLLIEEAVKEHAEVSDEEVQQAYDEYVPAVTAQHILVQDEETANDLINQLNDGADFGELAQEHSQDPGTAAQGGELTFTSGEMVEPFEEAAFALEEGEMTQEPVATDYGFHIIQMNEKPKKGTLEEERGTIEEMMLEEKMTDQEFVHQTLSSVIQDANVVINDDDLSGALQAYMPQPETADTSETTDTSEESETDTSEEAETDTSAENEADTSEEATEDTSADTTDTSEE